MGGQPARRASSSQTPKPVCTAGVLVRPPATRPYPGAPDGGRGAARAGTTSRAHDVAGCSAWPAPRLAACAAAADEVVARRLDRAAGPASTSASSLPSRLLHDPGDDHRVHVGDVGAQRDRGHRVDAPARRSARWRRCSTTSACLPGVSEPVRSSSPATWAPSSVASCSISRAVSRSLGAGSFGSQFIGVDPGPLGAEGGPHLGEHVAGHRGHDVDRQARAQAELAAP